METTVFASTGVVFALYLLLAVQLSPHFFVHGQQPQICSIFLDPSTSSCPGQPWQNDKICQIARQEGSCVDCFDCDPCRQFEYNPAGCTANGCYFCPGDALCSSVPYTQEHWDNLQHGLETDQLHPSCLVVEDWQTSATTTATPTTFTDPLIPAMQWMYDMIDIEPVWQSGLYGNGIHVRVNDIGGVEGTHAEFDNRFSVADSCENYLPTLVGPASIWQHGTGVASIVVGGANNEQCAAGIAPLAALSACALPAVANPQMYAEIMQFRLDTVDISVNSWSLDSCVQKGLIARERRKERILRNLQQQADSTTSTTSPPPATTAPLAATTPPVAATAPPVAATAPPVAATAPPVAATTTMVDCPFSNELSNSPCSVCGTSLNTMTDTEQLTSDCKLAIAAYCTTRYEQDIEACSEYMSVYAECDYDSVLTLAELQSLDVGILQGRGGKGVIFMMAAGNNYVNGDSTNGQKWTNTRFTISVGAVGKDGKHASYSAIGSSLFISAPGGDLDHLANNMVARVGGGCTDISAGTSFANPVVAGVVALMLEVNPTLTWRDVQGILASTSEQIDPDDESWMTNAAGFHHSYKYGFGLVKATAAVDAARSWENWPGEEYAVVQSELLNLPIPVAVGETGGEAAVTSVALNLGDLNVVTESVAVLVSIEHPSRGDLEIILTSPQGTQSILHASPRPENKHLDPSAYWELMTVRHWGENPSGEWTLSIRDTIPGNIADDCVDIPWSYLLGATDETPTGAKVTCSSIFRSQTCGNGLPLNPNVGLLQDANLLTPLQACCVCGGGQAPTEQSRLGSWTLVMFGRTLPATVPSATTDAPANNGVDATTQEPINPDIDDSEGNDDLISEGSENVWEEKDSSDSEGSTSQPPEDGDNNAESSASVSFVFLCWTLNFCAAMLWLLPQTLH